MYGVAGAGAVHVLAKSQRGAASAAPSPQTLTKPLRKDNTRTLTGVMRWAAHPRAPRTTRGPLHAPLLAW